jgi:hypothetical protein
LEEKGFIVKSEPEPNKKGNPRKVFQISPAGETIWKTATLEALSRPKTTYTNFLMGLHNLLNIPPDEALEAVRTYRNWLKKDLQRQRDELDSFEISFFPLDVLFNYGFVLGDAELSFLADLITRLEQMVNYSGQVE